MTIKDLLYQIAKEYRERNNYGISRTKLIKLAYLADIFFKRQTNKRLTAVRWIFWKYGPYLMDYPDILNSNAFIIEARDDDFQPVEADQEYEPPYIEPDEEIAISKAMDFADEDINDLLDFVYFDTEPMMNVNTRGEELNFDYVKPEETYRIRKYAVNDEIKKDIEKKIKDWKQRKSVSY